MSIMVELLCVLLGAALAIGAVALLDLSSAQRAQLESTTRPRGMLLGMGQAHPFHHRTLIALPAGHALMVGNTSASDEALLAAASAWDGALIFIDGRGLSQNLQRADAIRLAPARPSSAQYNPLQAIGTGPRAWIAALALARGLLGPDAERARTFAALMLDHLMTAPIEQRTLPALRARLQNPKQLVAELAALWTPSFAADQAPHAELARIAATLTYNPMKAAADIEHADRALRFLADGRFAASCTAHDVDLSDLIAGDGPTSLIIETPFEALDYAAPFIAGLLAQLVGACTSAPDADPGGRTKQRPLLLVIEAEAHAALEGFMQGAPLLPSHAARFGLSALTQSETPPPALALDEFDAVVGLGPQRLANAEALSARVGRRRVWRPGHPFASDATWKTVLRGAISDAPILNPTQLQKLGPHEAFILMEGTHRRARTITLTRGGQGRLSILPREALKAPIPNWTAPPLERRAPLATKPQLQTPAKLQVSKSTQIRKALTRKPARALAPAPTQDQSP